MRSVPGRTGVAGGTTLRRRLGASAAAELGGVVVHRHVERPPARPAQRNHAAPWHSDMILFSQTPDSPHGIALIEAIYLGQDFCEYH